jgi:hypothetical protein
MAKKTTPKLTSDDILALLAAKHSQDVFIPECKNGPSEYGGQRMDAWVMAKSWAHPKTIVYEIKVSRSDFLGDDKWTGYLENCNEFYFVCAPGVVNDVSEIPHNAGYMTVSSNGGKLFTKKKAPYRTVTVPENVYRYILMWRAKIRGESDKQSGSDAEFWRKWLKEKEVNRDLGRAVSKSIREQLEAKVFAVECNQKRLEKLIEGYADVRSTMERLGLNPDSNWDATAGNIQRAIDALNNGHTKPFIRAVGRFQDDVQRFRAVLDKFVSGDKDV